MREVLLVSISILSGALGGMGVGGGIILIPILTTFFGIGQKNAQYINLIYFVPVALCALLVHIRAGRFEWKKAVFMALGAVVGAIIGSEFTRIIHSGILRRLFGVFLLVVGIDQLRKPKKNNKKLEE